LGVAERDGAGHVEAGAAEEHEDGVEEEGQVLGRNLDGEHEELPWSSPGGGLIVIRIVVRMGCV
jgi:hypothetical protein